MKAERSEIVARLLKEMQFRNYSPSSIKTYIDLASKVENALNTPLDQITGARLKEYLHRRITIDGISTSLVNQYLSAYKIVQVDVLKRDWEELKIKRPRREKKLPIILSENEIESLISATRNSKHKALLMLAYSAGLRRQEVQQIKPSAIDSARMQVNVIQGKGKKDRYTLLSAKALEALRLYYKQERPTHFLFEPQGKKGKMLSETTLNNIVKNSAKRAGIKKSISFHTLRHCFATHLLEKGVNLRLIQQFMGHVSLRTTSIYLHLVNINMANVISPLDSMNI